MIESIYENCMGKNKQELVVYLKSEIDKHPISSYKDMSTEMKHYMHKLYSFLWFTNECDDIKHTFVCMKKMADTKGFYDRNKIINDKKLQLC